MAKQAYVEKKANKKMKEVSKKYISRKKKVNLWYKRLLYGIWGLRFKYQIVFAERSYLFRNWVSIVIRILILASSSIRPFYLIQQRACYYKTDTAAVQSVILIILESLYPVFSILICLKSLMGNKLLLRLVKYSLLIKFIYIIRYNMHFLVINSQVYYAECFLDSTEEEKKAFFTADTILYYTIIAEFFLLLYPILFEFRELSFKATIPYLIIYIFYNTYQLKYLAMNSSHNTMRNEYFLVFIDRMSVIGGYFLGIF